MALGGCHLVVRHNNPPIVGGSNMMDDGEDAQLRWGVWEGVILISGRQIEWSMTRRWTLPLTTMSMPLAPIPKTQQSTNSWWQQ